MTARGVGHVPCRGWMFQPEGVWEKEGRDLPSMFVFAGVFLTAGDETGLGSTGVRSEVFLFVAAALEAGVSFLTAVGKGFLAAAGVGLDAVLGVVLLAVTGGFFAGVDAAGLLAGVEVEGSFFTVPNGVLVLTGVAFAGVGAFGAAGVLEDVPAALSFFGTLLTGGVAASAAVDVFAGVDLVALEEDAVFDGDTVVFFAVELLP